MWESECEYFDTVQLAVDWRRVFIKCPFVKLRCEVEAGTIVRGTTFSFEEFQVYLMLFRAFLVDK